MELSRIIISETSEQQIIYLKEVGGDRTFPIVIGIFEATSIDRRVRGIVPPRPLTHDLLARAIEQLGGEIQDIYINDLRDHTYFAQLRIRHDGELIEVDSRPATRSPSPSPSTCRSTWPRRSSRRPAAERDAAGPPTVVQEPSPRSWSRSRASSASTGEKPGLIASDSAR